MLPAGSRPVRAREKGQPNADALVDSGGRHPRVRRGGERAHRKRASRAPRQRLRRRTIVDARTRPPPPSTNAKHQELRTMFTSRIAMAAVIALAAAGCNKTEVSAPEARPVRSVTVGAG